MLQKYCYLLAAILFFSQLASADVFCRYEKNGAVYYGQVEGEQVHRLAKAPWYGVEHTDFIDFLSDVTLLHPTEPQKIIGIAGSYKEAWVDQEPFKTVRWFSKPPTAAASPGDPVYLPAALDTLLVETEFVIVIGQPIKNGNDMQAKNAIFGYTIGNDIVGDVESYHRVNEEPIDQEETLLSPSLKMGDGFAPFGPFIYTGEDWKDRERTLIVHNPETNKREIYKHNTSSMIWPPEKIVKDLSRVFSLNPGDIIFSGTTKALPAQAGDIMEVSVEGWGTIINQVKATPKN